MSNSETPTEDLPLSVLTLPIDALAYVMSLVALAEVRGVARFGVACRAARALATNTQLIARMVRELGAPEGIGTQPSALEGLAIHQAVLENIGTCGWFIFKPGSAELESGETPRLSRAATLMRRHAGCFLAIETHAAAAAPDEAADKLAGDRAGVVLRTLLGRTVPRAQLRVRAWGRRLSSAANWADEPTSARA